MGEMNQAGRLVLIISVINLNAPNSHVAPKNRTESAAIQREDRTPDHAGTFAKERFRPDAFSSAETQPWADAQSIRGSQHRQREQRVERLSFSLRRNIRVPTVHRVSQLVAVRKDLDP